MRICWGNLAMVLEEAIIGLDERGIPRRCTRYVLRGGKMRNLIADGYAEECEGVGCRSEVRKESEEVFCIQLCAGEGPGDVHAALDIGGEQ